MALQNRSEDRLKDRTAGEGGQVTIWNKGWGEIPICLGWLTRNREETRVKAALDVIRYVWRKPTLVDGGSMTDKCWV